MMADILNSESDENLLLLNYAVRLMTSISNREMLLNNALECFGDFARSNWTGILTLSADGKSLCFEHVFSDKKVVSTRGEVSIENSPLADILFSRDIALHPLASAAPVPLPAFSGVEQQARCLCLPMVSSDLHPVGVVTIEIAEEEHLSFAVVQDLRMLTTVLTISMENCALFAQVLKDGLTGVYVRKYGETRLTEELARIRRYQGSVAVIFFDIDRFKEINDLLGHQAGDQALREFAQMVQACLRRDIDLVCRYGGDEFIVLLPHTTLDQACEIAERIRCECMKHFSFAPFTNVPVSVTGGVALADHGTPLTSDELLLRADRALYQAKEAGRNRIEVWKED